MGEGYPGGNSEGEGQSANAWEAAQAQWKAAQEPWRAAANAGADAAAAYQAGVDAMHARSTSPTFANTLVTRMQEIQEYRVAGGVGEAPRGASASFYQSPTGPTSPLGGALVAHYQKEQGPTPGQTSQPRQ